MTLKKMRQLLVLGTCLAGSSIALAGDRGTPSTELARYEVLTKPAAALTPDDLWNYLDLAFAEAITAEQARQFLARLSPPQRLQLRTAIESLAEKKVESREALYQARANQAFLAPKLGAQAMMACDPRAQEKGFCWLQGIERYHTSVLLEHKRAAWHQRYTTICDDDPGDTDLVVYFPVSSINPDNIMWGSSSSTITTLLDSVLSGFDFDNVGAHLCINTLATKFYSDAAIANSLTLYVKR